MTTPGNNPAPAPGCNPTRLSELIQRHVDGVLTDTEAAELNAALLDSPDAAAQLATAMRLDAAITRTLRSDTTAPSTKPDAERERGVGIAPGSAPTLSAAGAPIYRKGHEPQPTRIRPVYYAVAGVAAALLAACGLAIYVYSSPLPHSEIPDPTSRPPVATLIEATDGKLTTPHGYPAEGDDFSAGEYRLASGKAEFMLTNAVNVKLRGRSRIDMRNNMNVVLTNGSAEFVVPRDATGFTVHLPDKSRIRDLGTAFRVDVDKKQRIVLRVTDGAVEWISAEPGAVPVLIQAGHGLRIVSGQAGPVIPGTAMSTQSAFNESDGARNVPGPLESGIPNPALIAHWKFDEGAARTASDSSLDRHHATAIAPGVWVAGKVGGAVRRPAFRVTESNDFHTSGAVAVSAWVKPGRQNKWAVIAGLDAFAKQPSDSYALKQDKEGHVHWTLGMDDDGLTSAQSLASLSAAQEDGWVHIVGVYEPGVVSALYINGKLSRSAEGIRIKTNSNLPFSIGVYANRDHAFTGSIDELQVYRVALTADEIRDLYDNHGATIDRQSDRESETKDPDRPVAEPEEQTDLGLPTAEEETSQ